MKPKGWKLDPQWVMLDTMRRRERHMAIVNRNMMESLQQSLETALEAGQVVELRPNNGPTRH